jgi:hypothetical protein
MVALVKRPTFDPLVSQARELLEDYLRIREFRKKELVDRPLVYADAEGMTSDLLPAVAELMASQQDPEQRLEEIRKHFGAPKAGRTRNPDWKAIEFSGPLTALTEDLDAEVRIAGPDGQWTNTATFNAAGTPLAEQACFGKLKLGEEVTLVAKVAMLDYDGTPDNNALRFTLEPLVSGREQVGSAESSRGRKGDSKSPKQKDQRPRRTSAVRDKDVG